MERSIVGIQRAPRHPTQIQTVVAVQAVGVIHAQEGIELTLICVEYYQDAFAILCRLRVTDVPDNGAAPPPIIIPFVHAQLSDATGAAYAVEYEPFLGSSADYRGILRVTPMLPQPGVPYSVIIDAVTLYTDDGQQWHELQFDANALVYTIVGGQTAP